LRLHKILRSFTVLLKIAVWIDILVNRFTFVYYIKLI